MLKPVAFLLAAPLAFAAVAVPSLEHARLVRLGFDTERAEDDWCRLELDIPRASAGRHLFIEFDGSRVAQRAAAPLDSRRPASLPHGGAA